MKSKEILFLCASTLSVIVLAFAPNNDWTLVFAAVEDGKDAVERELAKFQGSWIPYKNLNRGKDFPPENEGKREVAINGKTMRFFEGGQLVATVEFHIDPSTKPRSIDLVAKPKDKDKTRIVPGIYEFEGDSLKIATGFGQNEIKTRPEGFEPQSKLHILIFKRGK